MTDQFLERMLHGENPDGYEAQYLDGQAITVRIKDPRSKSLTKEPEMIEASGYIKEVDNDRGLYHIVLTDGKEIKVDTRKADEYMAQRQSGLDGAMDMPIPNGQ